MMDGVEEMREEIELPIHNEISFDLKIQ